MNDVFQALIENGPFIFASGANTVLKSTDGLGEKDLHHGIQIMLEPILEELSELESDGFKALDLSGQKDQTEYCQARLQSVIMVVDFIEANDAGDLLLAARHLLHLAKAVIDTQVDVLYSRPAPDDSQVQPMVQAPTLAKPRRQEVPA